MNKLFVQNIGELNNLQLASFYHFLNKGVSKEFYQIKNPLNITQNKKLLLYFYPNDLKLLPNNININKALKNNLSYTINLYFPSEYINKKFLTHSFRKIKDIYIGEIPMMTDDGSFILDGCERIIISQIIRSPGIYFNREFARNNKVRYLATIVSDQGLWLKFSLDIEKKTTTLLNLEDIKLNIDYFHLNEINATNEKITQISVLSIIKYFNINFLDFFDMLKYPEHIFYKNLLKIKKTSIDFFIEQILFNPHKNYFSLGSIGRYKINNTFNLFLDEHMDSLTIYDFICLINGLLELKYNDTFLDDIDHMQNKQIRSIGDLLQRQLRIQFSMLKKAIDSIHAKKLVLHTNYLKRKTVSYFKQKYAFLYNYNKNFICIENLYAISQEFFKTSDLSQLLDQTNPLAELTHKRKFSLFGPNGLKRDQISNKIRDINPSQYAKTCPLETPEGQNAGLIATIPAFTRVNFLGSFETPYILFNTGANFLTKKAFYMDSIKEAQLKIALCNFFLSQQKKIEVNTLFSKEHDSFLFTKTEKIDALTISPLQIISISAGLIPFLEHNDATRVLMGSNMQRQAVPLLYAKKCIIGTGYEYNIALDSSIVIKAYNEGCVLKASSNLIILQDVKDQKIYYFLKKYTRSNQKTCINQRPLSWVGEKIFSGEIIADTLSTLEGELSLGRNLLISYMSWEGYNYEDAIILNERLLSENIFTSIHLKKYDITLVDSSIEFEKTTPFLSQNSYITRHLDLTGVARIGSCVKEFDILVGKICLRKKDFSLDYLKYYKLGYDIRKLTKKLYRERTAIKETSFITPQEANNGFIVDIRYIENLVEDDSLQIHIAQIKQIKLGDKLAGRHGNKGIVSIIVPKQDMPFLPNGISLDIILNPLGVPSRMNVGQIFESLVGFAAQNIETRLKIVPFDEIYGENTSRILIYQKLKEAAIKTQNNWVFNPSFPGKIFLKDGRTGEYFDNPITTGKSYILKLNHLVDEKIQARTVGPYQQIAEQPLGGKSVGGGQRFGEMEVWALEAYGCSHTLQELLTIKSDDIEGRNNLEEALSTTNNVKPVSRVPEAFLVLIKELNALGLAFSFKNFDSGFYSTLDYKNKTEKLFAKLEHLFHFKTNEKNSKLLIKN